MFGLSFEKIIIIAVIASVVIGPQRLPLYAGKLAQFVRKFRAFTDTAKTQVKDMLEEEGSDIDWKSLDPRKYDPRRIIRESISAPLDSVKDAAER